MAEVAYWEAVNLAISEAMAADDRVIVWGEDVAAPGGVFGVTRRLHQRYGPSRVLDAPISENAFTGAAIGASMMGLKPIIELMFMDFSLVAADQLINHAAKISYMSNGQYRVPLVVRTQQGSLAGSSAQHSQSLEHLFACIPGLKVVCPSDAADAYALMHAAIADDDPVIFIEHRGLYPVKGEIHPAESRAGIGAARVVRQGDDVTLIAWLESVVWAQDVASQLHESGVSVEVIDLRSIQPVDYETVCASVRRTGRLAILHAAPRVGGWGAELTASVHEALPNQVDSRRFGAGSIPMPVAPLLQDAVQPDLRTVVSEIHGWIIQKEKPES